MDGERCGAMLRTYTIGDNSPEQGVYVSIDLTVSDARRIIAAIKRCENFLQNRGELEKVEILQIHAQALTDLSDEAMQDYLKENPDE